MSSFFPTDHTPKRKSAPYQAPYDDVEGEVRPHVDAARQSDPDGQGENERGPARQQEGAKAST